MDVVLCVVGGFGEGHCCSGADAGVEGVGVEHAADMIDGCLRDVQEAASHADPRTTMRYDRARQSLDRHATYVVAAFLAGAARSS